MPQSLFLNRKAIFLLFLHQKGISTVAQSIKRYKHYSGNAQYQLIRLFEKMGYLQTYRRGRLKKIAVTLKGMELCRVLEKLLI